jgi:hypothetical protein
MRLFVCWSVVRQWMSGTDGSLLQCRRIYRSSLQTKFPWLLKEYYETVLVSGNIFLFFFCFSTATPCFGSWPLQQFASRYSYPLLLSSIFLYSASTSTPSWSLPTSVMVFPSHYIMEFSSKVQLCAA